MAHVDSVRRSFAAWQEQDFEALVAAIGVDARWDFDGFEGWPEGSGFEGRAGLRALWETWLAPWEEIDFQPVRLAGVGDKVFAHGRIRARGKESGVPVEIEYWQVTTFDAPDHAVLNELYSDPATALAAAGLAA